MFLEDNRFPLTPEGLVFASDVCAAELCIISPQHTPSYHPAVLVSVPNTVHVVKLLVTLNLCYGQEESRVLTESQAACLIGHTAQGL